MRAAALGLGRATMGDAGFQQIQAAGDAGEEIIEIMREAAGELADRLHFLGLAQFFLGGAPLRELDRLDGQGVGLTGGITRRAQRDVEHTVPAG